MADAHPVVAALLALAVVACGPPRSPDVKPTPPAAPADAGADASSESLFLLDKGVPLTLPGTSLEVTLVDAWYGERVVGDDAGLTASAELTVRAGDGRRETVTLPSYEPRTVLGVRLRVHVSRDGVYLQVLPAAAE